MSKEMPLKVFAKQYSWNPKEEQWILDNDKDTHYYNNSALPKAWSSLSYPIYNGDYYFAFIHDKVRVNAQYNAKANRELRKYIKSTLSAEEIYDKMEKYFAMQFKDAGSGDTMTREELWTAIIDMRKKNPVKEDAIVESKDEKKYRGKEQKSVDKLIMQKGVDKVQQHHDKNPKEFDKMVKNLAMMEDASDIVEVTDKEIMAMRKVSKDMQKVLKDYQKIATMGDKELKDTKHNGFHEKVLDARDTVVTMIGTLQTKKLMQKESLMDTYKKMHEESLMEAEIVYRVRDMQKPEETKMKQASRMGLKVSMKKQGKDTIVTLSGTKKNLRDFDSIARGKSSYGDPSSIKHFDEK